MIFDAIRKEKNAKFYIEENAKEAHKGLKYSGYHEALVIWSI